jgi:hypothetical protein
LRLLIAALVMIALAGPVYNPAEQIAQSGPVRLVIDNGWAAAQTWDSQSKASLEMLGEAAREQRQIYILPTAVAVGEEKIQMKGPFTAAQAEGIVKELKPVPWPADYMALAELVKKDKGSIYSFWFSHGLDEGGFDALAETLESQGGLTLFSPAAERLPVLLKLPEQPAPDKMQMAVTGPDAIPPGRPVTLQAIDGNGGIVDQQGATLKPGATSIITFETPEKLRGDIAQFRLSGAPGVGGVYVLDERYKKRSVGIVGPAEDTDPKPFIEARYYIQRAIEPFTTIFEGTPEEVLKHEPSVIILPDTGALAAETLNALEKWVRSGGLLLRFAGPNMAQATSQAFLTPTPLRSGGRSLDGSLSWEKPQKLLPFAETSPLNGIALHENIMIKRQILAEPVPDLDQKTWAKLEDGTPLITAAPLDKGMLVMVHTGADAAWSDLPLSGVFVEILKRIVSLSGQAQTLQNQTNGLLEPLEVFDGFGVLKTPDGTVQSIEAVNFETTIPGPVHPPGLYGRNGIRMALNLGDHIKSLDTPAIIPAGVTGKIYGQNYEFDLLPYVLYAALVFLLLDWAIMLVMAGGMKPFLRFAGVSSLLFLFVFPAQAGTIEQDLKYADGFYLAFIQSGDPALDALSQQGLANLAGVLKRRTSVEPDGVVPLNPETDTLIFFPVIYWPVSRVQGDLSETALTNIQHYLDHGGTILFDTRDGNAGGDGIQTPNADHLRALIARLSIPALAPIPKDHVLLRSFYLLSGWPGRISDGTLWVETQSVTGRDNVSSVIIGSNDWAGSWAEGGGNELSGGTRRQELALRFGVNVAMYALTGNYKADQVHVKNILERLGQ